MYDFTPSLVAKVLFKRHQWCDDDWYWNIYVDFLIRCLDLRRKMYACDWPYLANLFYHFDMFL